MANEGLDQELSRIFRPVVSHKGISEASNEAEMTWRSELLMVVLMGTVSMVFRI